MQINSYSAKVLRESRERPRGRRLSHYLNTWQLLQFDLVHRHGAAAQAAAYVDFDVFGFLEVGDELFGLLIAGSIET